DSTIDNDFQDIEYNSTTTNNSNNEEEVTYFTKELASQVVYHTLTSIEYPKTSSEGVAYIYNVES
ncbi:6357_t:CDS:1, partial [Acaulospora morrowiae]